MSEAIEGLREKLATLRGYESYADLTNVIKSEELRGYYATHYHLSKRQIDDIMQLFDQELDKQLQEAEKFNYDLGHKDAEVACAKRVEEASIQSRIDELAQNFLDVDVICMVDSSRARAQVKFPDGTIKYGVYNGMADVYMEWLFDTPEEAWDCWSQYKESGFDNKKFDNPFDDTYYDVEIADDYGGGNCYIGRAGKSSIVSAVSADRMNRKGDGGLPDWWKS